MIDHTSIVIATLTAGLTIIAQAATEFPSIPGLGQIGSMTANAAVIWYCWYTTTTTNPNMMKEFREEGKSQRESAERVISSIVTSNERNIDKLSGSIERLSGLVEHLTKA